MLWVKERVKWSIAMDIRHFEQALQTLRRGDRENGYRLMRQVLLEDPTYAPAWFWMSRLVDDGMRKRECLERALALDPHYKLARDALERLPVPDTTHLARSIAMREPQKLGAYLVERGFITKEQLDVALVEQRYSRGWGKRVPLGDILIRRGFLTPQALAHSLLIQQQDKLQPRDGRRPERLGEYLIAEYMVAPEQLEAALAEQARLRQSGQYIVLGELLSRWGYLKPDALERVLERQRHDFFGSFGD
jgi:hypothetical protein